MKSKAQEAFDENVKDIKRLLELHEQIGGKERGRRYDLEVLNKSAIVLITAFWESYCEDIASEGLEHIVKHAKSAEALPDELKKKVAKDIKNQKHELELWKIADNGWRTYLSDRLEIFRETRNRTLNTPKANNIDELFLSTVGIKKISNAWRWGRNMPPKKTTDKLDKFVVLRGAIAHRGKSHDAVKKAQVNDYFDFIQRLAVKTSEMVNSHVTDITEVPLGTKRRPRTSR